MRHTREKQNLFLPFHVAVVVVVVDGVDVLPCPPYLILLFYRLVFYNFFLAGTWIKLRRVMQTFVRYFPDEASQVRPRPSRYQPYYLIRILFPIVNVWSKDKYIILKFVCVTFIKCGISVIEWQNNWQIFSQVIFVNVCGRPLNSARELLTIPCCAVYGIFARFPTFVSLTRKVSRFPKIRRHVAMHNCDLWSNWFLNRHVWDLLNRSLAKA